MSETARARQFLIGLTGCAYIVVPVLAWVVGLSVDLRGFAEVILAAMVFLLVFAPLCHWRRIPSLKCIVECAGIGLLITAPLIVSAYTAFALDLPLQDQQLLELDRRLGIDWVSLIAFIDSTALLAKSLTFAYHTFHHQLFSANSAKHLRPPRSCVSARRDLRTYLRHPLASSPSGILRSEPTPILLSILKI